MPAAFSQPWSESLGAALNASPPQASAASRCMEALLEPALGIVHETFEQYLTDVLFRLDLDDFVDFAADQFARRRSWIEKARSQTPAEVLRQPVATVEHE